MPTAENFSAARLWVNTNSEYFAPLNFPRAGSGPLRGVTPSSLHRAGGSLQISPLVTTTGLAGHVWADLPTFGAPFSSGPAQGSFGCAGCHLG